MAQQPIAPPAVVKPGIHTTEFWLTVVVALAALAEQLAGYLPAPWGPVAAALAAAAYAISRGLAKQPTTQ